jgi:acetyl-CoA carboxylase beta subunit
MNMTSEERLNRDKNGWYDCHINSLYRYLNEWSREYNAIQVIKKRFPARLVAAERALALIDPANQRLIKDAQTEVDCCHKEQTKYQNREDYLLGRIEKAENEINYYQSQKV